jgi:hypothetical protein
MSLSRFGKMSLAAGAMMVAGLLGSSAPASADYRDHRDGGYGGYHRGGGDFAPRGFYGPRPGYGYGRGYRHCVVRRVWVQTPYGQQMVRRRVCR